MKANYYKQLLYFSIYRYFYIKLNTDKIIILFTKNKIVNHQTLKMAANDESRFTSLPEDFDKILDDSCFRDVNETKIADKSACRIFNELM